MGEDHKFTWSNFNDQTRCTFNKLIEDTDFLDVTLVTDDNKQIKAHKVILSACSPLFKKILATNPHQHPLLFLKGISSCSLGSILQFIYLGEVNISIDNLDSFIQASDELKIIGMLDSEAQDENLMPKRSHSGVKRKRKASSENKQPNIHDVLADIQTVLNVENEEQVPIDHVVDVDDDIVEIVQNSDVTVETEFLFCDKCDYETHNSLDYSEHMRTSHVNDIPCKECKFRAKDNNELKNHILNEHQGLPCNYCRKRFSDLSFLRKHVLESATYLYIISLRS